jgi:hypothetical protein
MRLLNSHILRILRGSKLYKHTSAIICQSKSFSLTEKSTRSKAFPFCNHAFIVNSPQHIRTLKVQSILKHQLNIHSDSAEANPLFPNRTRQHRPNRAIKINRLKLTQTQHATRDTHHHCMRRFLDTHSSSEQFNLAFYQTESVFPELFMLNSSIRKDDETSKTAMPSDATQL